MNTKETLKQIKVLLGMEKPEEKIEVALEMTESKLKDGTNVSYDKLEIGSALLIRTDAETTVPAPAGDYELADGTIVTVGPDNLITEVKVPEATANDNTDIKPEEQPTVEEPVEEVEPEDEKEMRIAACEDKIKKLEEAMNLLLGDYSEMKAEFDAQSEKVNEIAGKPADEPVHFAKKDKKTDTPQESVFERRLRLINEIKK